MDTRWPTRQSVFCQDPTTRTGAQQDTVGQMEAGLYLYIVDEYVLLSGLNVDYDTNGGERLSGLLLHTKFLNTFHVKV